MTPLEHVRELERARFAAVVDERWDELEPVFHPDLRYVHATATIDTRESYLVKLRGGHYDYRWIEHEVEDEWVSSETVLLWGRMRSELRAGERVKEIDNRTLSVWVRDESGWRLIAQQPTAFGASS